MGTLADYYRSAGLPAIPEFAETIQMRFDPFQHQVGDLNHLARFTRAGLLNEPGCYSGDTEYLSPTGWRRIDQYDGGKVMQYRLEDGVATFVQPSEYIKLPCDTFLHFKARSVDQMLSPEHRVLYQNNLGKKLVTSAEDIYRRHKGSKEGWSGRFLTTFRPDIETSLQLTDEQLRVMVALFADGSLSRSKSTQCHISVKKDRKISRLHELLQSAEIEYQVRRYESNPEICSFVFYAPLRLKVYDAFWSANSHQLEVIVDEVFHWDGHVSERPKDGRAFYTTNKGCADFIQYAISSTGNRARMCKREQMGMGTKPVYEVMETVGSNLTTIRGAGKDYCPIVVTHVENEYKYCFTVPDTFLVMRREDKIFISGNTGKTLPVQAYGIWLANQGNKVVYTMPPMLVAQFAGTFAKSYPGYEDHLTVGILQGLPKKRNDLIRSWGEDWPDILVMSYRMFVEYHKQLKLERGYNCVIVDEATAVKSPGSQLHNAVKIFGGNHRKDSNGVVLMTGSPVDTNVSDAYGLIAILTPDRYGSKKMFERTHCVFAPTGPNMQYQQIIAYQNYDVLNQSLFAQGRRVKKADVSDLPPRLITEIQVILNRSHRDLYKKAVDERMIEIGDRVLDMTEQSALYQAMQRLLLNPEQFTDQAIESEALVALDALLDTLDGKKVVVYAWFQSSVEKLKLRYKHLNPATLYGKTVGKNREAEKLKFINDPTCKLIIANPRSGGVGVDGFQDVSSHVVFAEVCPFPGVFQQSIDRLHRTGQKAESVNVYILVPTNTIAVKLRNDLLRKDTQQELVVQDKRTILSALMGDEGVKGSLDSLSYAVESVDDKMSVDTYKEAA